VLEDVHAADEATLDVLRVLARRIEAFPSLVIATYRDVGLDRWHPLRVVLGEIVAVSQINRLRLSPLSPEAVTRLAALKRVGAMIFMRKRGATRSSSRRCSRPRTRRSPPPYETPCSPMRPG
jgi:hypothetical protein